MEILMFGWEFPPHNSGGLGTACYGLTKSLNKKGISIKLVLPGKVKSDVDFVKIISEDNTYLDVHNDYIINSLLTPYATDKTYEARLFNEEVALDKSQNNSIYGRNLFEEVERYAIIGARIASLEKFDIIHAHDWLTFKAAIAAKKVSGKSLVVHVHATEFDRTGGNGVNQYVYDIEKNGMEEADVIIAVSNYTKEKIINNYGINPSKIQVVHNGVEHEDYSLDRLNALRNHNKVVLFLGRLTLQKGPDYFVYTAKKVLEHYKDVIFVVSGSGDMEKFIIRKVAELGISDKFIFTGFLRGKDVLAVYKMADLFVMPSVSEPFGIVPLESLMQGTPVLISKQSGVSEVLNHCLKTDFWDTDEMANKIVAVLRYDELRRCLQENGAKEAEKMNWDNPADKCIDIYNNIRGQN